MRYALLLGAGLVLVRCTLITCDEICDPPPVDGGAAGGGAAGGSAGGSAGGDAGGAAGGDAGGSAGGAAGGDAGGAAGGSAGGAAGGGAAGGAAHTSVVFVTNATFHGNFSAQAGGFFGAAAADRLCQVAAMNASLPGTFKAWVSGGPGMTPSSRLNDSSPWQLRGTTTNVFSSKASLNGTPIAPINRDEDGLPLPLTNTNVWTGASTGATQGVNCMTWSQNVMGQTAIVGSTQTVIQWTSTGAPRTCDQPAHLYCFEQQ